MRAKPMHKYLWTIALTAAVILGGVIAVNALIDPYAMNLGLQVPGVNAYKSAVLDRVRLLKAYEVRRFKPDSVILGTSRCHIGFRPGNAAWRRHAARPYNLAFDSATTEEMYFYLLHAQAVHPLKLVLLGLDIYHPTDAESMSLDFDPSFLLPDNSLFSRLKLALNDIKILSSFDTLKSSLSTLRSQHTGHPVWFAPDGQRLGAAFFRRSDSDMGRLGPRGYFDKYERLQIQVHAQEDHAHTQKKAYHESAAAPQDTLSSLDYVRRIINFCRDNRIQLIIFFTPSHVHELEMSNWDTIIAGKRNMVKMLADDEARYPGRPPIPLWDFSLYSSVTTDPLPPKGSKAELKYYWDYSHFKDFVGDWVLNRILGAEDPQNPAPADFGLQLTPQNIEAVIAKLNADRAAYQARHPQDIERLDAWKKDFEEHPNDKP